MNIKYFSDTDTLHLVLSGDIPAETKEISDNLLVDLSADGHVLSVTIEHARAVAALQSFSYEVVDNNPSNKTNALTGR
jgi:uncharacterized protein YuzE